MLLIKGIPDQTIRNMAVNNCIRLKTAKDESEAMDLELVHAFNWRRTEGHEFWSIINKIYTRNGNN